MSAWGGKPTAGPAPPAAAAAEKDKARNADSYSQIDLLTGGPLNQYSGEPPATGDVKTSPSTSHFFLHVSDHFQLLRVTFRSGRSTPKLGSPQ